MIKHPSLASNVNTFMDLLVFGNDSCTHVFAWKLINSNVVQELILAPGNGGTAFFAPSVALGTTDQSAIASFLLSEAIDLVVVDQAAIAAGVSDEVRALPLPVFGADRSMLRLIQSRCALREWLQHNNIPTPRSRVCSSQAQAEKYAATLPHPLVIAADDPNGPVIVCADRTAVPDAIAECFAGATAVLVEEAVRGPLLTAALLTDGQTALPVPATRLYATAAHPYASINGVHSAVTPLWHKLEAVLQQHVREPLSAALAQQGGARGWISTTCVAGPRGPLVQSLQLVPSGFEAAAVLLRLDSDLLPLLNGCAQGTLAMVDAPRWREAASIGVGLAAATQAVSAVPSFDSLETGVLVFHQATQPSLPNEYVPRAARYGGARLARYSFGSSYTSAGAADDRPADPLVAIVATSASDLQTASRRVYANLERGAIDRAMYRQDVGAREL